jgi:hypothetical protein
VEHATNSEQDKLFVKKNVRNFRMFYTVEEVLVLGANYLQNNLQ